MAKSKKQDASESTEPKPAKPTAKKAAAAPEAKPAKPAKAEAVKSEPVKAEAPAKSNAAKPVAKAPATKGAAKPAAPATKPSVNPAFASINAASAARAAASLVANRDLLGGLNLTPTAPANPAATTDAAKPEPKVESTSFKNLKQNLTQPGAALNKVLGLPSNQKKGGIGFGGGGMGGMKGQSSGGGGNRPGVPRRTNG